MLIIIVVHGNERIPLSLIQNRGLVAHGLASLMGGGVSVPIGTLAAEGFHLKRSGFMCKSRSYLCIGSVRLFSTKIGAEA